MTDILDRLKEACNGHPHAKIEWPHRVLHAAIAEITTLRERVTNLLVYNNQFEQRAREAERVVRDLTTPRPLDDWHEGMGDVVWWCWESPKRAIPVKDGRTEGLYEDIPGRWLGEAPYVGSPLCLGITVEAHVRLISQLDQEHEPQIVSRNLGGWPGYHTHWTPLPPEPEKPR